MAHDVKAAVDQGWRSIDRPEERYYAGPCGNQVNDPAGYYVCPTVLWTRLQAAHRPVPHLQGHLRRPRAPHLAPRRRRGRGRDGQRYRLRAHRHAPAPRHRIHHPHLGVPGPAPARWGSVGTAKLYRVRDVRAALERADAEPEAVGHAA
jgi:hypothetical protein